MQIISNLITSILNIISAIPLANSIASLSVADYTLAIHNVVLTLIIFLVKAVFSQISSLFHSKQLQFIYTSVQQKIFNKILYSDQIDFKNTSKEKIINTLTLNTTTVGNFCNSFAKKISSFIETITTLVIITLINLTIGLIFFISSLLLLFLINFLSKNISNKNKNIEAKQDLLSENFSNLIQGKSLTNELNLNNAIEEEYLLTVKQTTKIHSRKIFIESLKDNWINFLFIFIIYFCHIKLINLISINQLTLTTFLIITPYLTNLLSQTTSFVELFSDIQNINVSTLRIKTILDLDSKDIVNFGQNLTDSVKGILSFSNVEFNSLQTKNIGQLEKFNLVLQPKSITLFEGQRNCGKRIIFYLLKRYIRPSQGTITIDSINIYDFDKQTYNKNISWTTYNPHFYNLSILANLKYIEKSKTQIIKVLKTLDIYQKINQLPNKLDSPILNNNELSSYDKFMLGLARAILSQSEVLIIYEIPANLSQTEIKNIKRVLTLLKQTKTIIIFSASQTFLPICTTHIQVNNGKLNVINE